MPIASIITPATLSVETALVTPAPTQMMQVPNFDLASLDFVAPIAKGNDGFCFNGPSQPVQRVAAAVAAQGQILPIPAPQSNVSWSLDFWAPSLQCHDINGTQRDGILNNVLDHWGDATKCAQAPGYLSWTGSTDKNITDLTTPFAMTGFNSRVTTFQSAPLNYDSATAIYVATLPQLFNFAFLPSTAQTEEKCNFFGASGLMYSYPIADDLCLPGIDRPACYGQQAWFTDASLIRCDLVNATYSTVFSYTGETQIVNVTTNANGDSSAVVPHECFSEPSTASFQTADLRCNGTCSLNTVATRLLSYQGIASAFNALLLGTISMGGYGVGDTQVKQLTTKTPGMNINSSIATTILMDTEELAFVSDFNGVNQTYTYLQQDISESNDTMYRGVVNRMSTGQRGDLKSALETLFTNVTISLLAEEYLQANYSSPYAPARMTKVTYNTYHNVYIYSAITLWVAYGLAILFTLVALMLGMVSLALNKGSFKNDFSTVLRNTRMVAMTEELHHDEVDGRQPVPKRLAGARVMMGSPSSQVQIHPATSEPNVESKLPTAETSLLSRSSGQTQRIEEAGR